MRFDRFLLWLPLSSAVACGSGVVVLSAGRHCWALPWLCHDAEQVFELAVSEFLVLPLVIVLLARGLHAGVRQYRRTRSTLGQFLSLPRAVMPAPLLRHANALGIQRRLDLVQCSSPEAFCYGFIRPRICLTTGMLAILSPAELGAVLLHERHHLRRRDPLQAWLWTMLDAACWWMADAREQANLQRELAADRAVIRAGGRRLLAGALLKLLTEAPQSTLVSGEVAISGLSVTNARIDQLVRPDQETPRGVSIYRWLVPLVVVALTLLACSF